MTGPLLTPPFKLPEPWRETLATLSVGSALFLLFVDQTALTTALPALARDLNADPVQLKLALTVYMLIQAALAPAGGWLADRFGVRRVFLVSMALFLGGSALCALSSSLGDLILFRLVQGAGAALMVPLGRIIIIGVTPKERLVKAMLLYTLPAVIGPIFGPALTGVILSVADWPWIFWINIPFGLVGMWAVASLVPKVREPHPGKFDGYGFLLASITISGAMLVAETVGFDLVPWQVQVAAGVVAAACAVALMRHLNSAAKPVLDLKLFRYPAFRQSVLGGLPVRVGFGATPFLLPLLFQEGLGWTPLKTGLVLTASAVGAILARFTGPATLRRYGFRTVLIHSTLWFGLSTAVAAAFRDWTPLVVVILVLAFNGLVRATMFTAINTVAYDDMTNRQVSSATTLYTVVQQLALSGGVTLGALLLQLVRSGDGPLTPDRFVLPFVVVGVVAASAALAFRRMDPQTGAVMAGRAPANPAA